MIAWDSFPTERRDPGRSPEKLASGLPPLAPQPTGVRRIVLELVAIFALAAVMVVGARLVALDVRVIPSASMVPQLLVGDRVLVSRLAFVTHDPRRGDIVVFPPDRGTEALPASEPVEDTPFLLRPLRDVGRWVGFVDPPETEQDLIKRVIGLGGETVEGRDGAVFVNGRRLVEPYLPDGVVTSDFDPIVVPLDGLWVMGDNRGGSADSRSFGAIPADAVLGRAILRIWPLPRGAFI